MLNLTSKQLRRAAWLKDKTERYQREINKILGAAPQDAVSTNGGKPPRKKHRMSAAGRAAISRAMKARWAHHKAT